MTKQQYIEYTRTKLDEHGLKEWGIRIDTRPDSGFVGMCSYKDKVIILNSYHLELHPEPEVICTILHEIAHALCPGMGHNQIWAKKAREIGCDNTEPNCPMGFSPQLVDAIRSGASVEVTFEEQVIRKPKYEITRLQDRCPICGKVAKTKKEWEHISQDKHLVKFKLLDCNHTIRTIVPRGTPFDEAVRNDWKPEIKNCKHVWTKNQCNKCHEYKLYQFQVDGARAAEAGLADNKGYLIADEMGLGKTIQGLIILKYHPELLPALFVVKSGLKFQFVQAIEEWLGPAYYPQVIETTGTYVLPGLKAYIISYDMVKRMKPEKLGAIGIKTIILDECQQIKNVDSSRTQAIRKLANDVNIKVLGLSASPWKNRGSELFPILNMIDPKKFYSFERFRKEHVDYYFEGARKKEAGIRNPERFKAYVKDIMIRRERIEVMKELPLVNRTKLYVKLNQTEESLYNDALDEFGEWYQEQVMEGKEVNSLELIAKMTRMRHLVGLAKIPTTVEFVGDFIENEPDKKITIFAHHIDVADILADELAATGVPVLRLKGGMTSEARYHIQERFNKTKQCILIASTLAAGEGLNLQTCADAVVHERQWNPSNEEQAEGRFIRIGQTSNYVNATYTEAMQSIDSRFDGIVETKRGFIGKLMNNVEKGKSFNEASIVKELAEGLFQDFKAKNKDRMKVAKK